MDYQISCWQHTNQTKCLLDMIVYSESDKWWEMKRCKNVNLRHLFMFLKKQADWGLYCQTIRAASVARLTSALICMQNFGFKKTICSIHHQNLSAWMLPKVTSHFQFISLFFFTSGIISSERILTAPMSHRRPWIKKNNPRCCDGG